MKIKRMVKHSDTEFEIMEFELTEEELELANNEYEVRVDKEWIRDIYDEEFYDEYGELTDEQLDAAYSLYVVDSCEAGWEVARDSLARVLGEE